MTKCQDIWYQYTSKYTICRLSIVTIPFNIGNKVSKERDERNNPQKLHERGRA